MPSVLFFSASTSSARNSGWLRPSTYPKCSMPSPRALTRPRPVSSAEHGDRIRQQAEDFVAPRGHRLVGGVTDEHDGVDFAVVARIERRARRVVQPLPRLRVRHPAQERFVLREVFDAEGAVAGRGQPGADVRRARGAAVLERADLVEVGLGGLHLPGERDEERPRLGRVPESEEQRGKMVADVGLEDVRLQLAEHRRGVPGRGGPVQRGGQINTHLRVPSRVKTRLTAVSTHRPNPPSTGAWPLNTEWRNGTSECHPSGRFTRKIKLRAELPRKTERAPSGIGRTGPARPRV